MQRKAPNQHSQTRVPLRSAAAHRNSRRMKNTHTHSDTAGGSDCRRANSPHRKAFEEPDTRHISCFGEDQLESLQHPHAHRRARQKAWECRLGLIKDVWCGFEPGLDCYLIPGDAVNPCNLVNVHCVLHIYMRTSVSKRQTRVVRMLKRENSCVHMLNVLKLGCFFFSSSSSSLNARQ